MRGLTSRAALARARAVEVTDIYTELEHIVDEAVGRPRRNFRQLPGEAVARAFTENA